MNENTPIPEIDASGIGVHCYDSRFLPALALTRLPRHSTGQESFKLPCPNRVLQLADCLGFNLTHALARHFEDAAHFFQCVGVAVADAVAQLDDLAFAIGQRLEHLLDLVLE